MSILSEVQRVGHLATSRELFSNVKEIRDLPNGYEVRLDAPNVIAKVAEFVALERLCCPFLTFSIEVEAESGPVWLRLTGREGVKEFIREEINALLGTAIDWKLNR